MNFSVLGLKLTFISKKIKINFFMFLVLNSADDTNETGDLCD